jgi:hypothetical protein
MASYLIDKLEALKEDENKLKEQQRVLMEEIELKMEKKRRLELDGTIIKLRTQVDEIRKNIEGEIMPDNRLLVLRFGKQKNEPYERKQRLIREAELKRHPQLLTLEKFKDNLSKVTERQKEIVYSRLGGDVTERKQVFIPHQIKIYDDIIPIFTTMIGIMKKQELDIENLRTEINQMNIR